MAERKATNKYYPPDWDPSKGSVNKHKRSHPLRDRARKLDDGILIVRFEMPFDIWCLGCENHIAMGVRFNAEKSKVGNYYSSPIYKFRMKCRLCDNYFEIQTNPSKFDYLIQSGARRRIKLAEHDEQTTDYGHNSTASAADNNNDDESRRKIADAMYRLEKKVEDKVEGELNLPGLHELKRWRSRWEDSFAANQLIRSQHRQRRKRMEQKREKDKRLLSKRCLKMPLLNSDPIDRELAKGMLLQTKDDRLVSSEADQKQSMLNSKIILTTNVKIMKSAKPRTVTLNKDSTTALGSSLRIKRDPG